MQDSMNAFPRAGGGAAAGAGEGRAQGFEVQLTRLLARGAARLPASFRDRVRAGVERCQVHAGVFRARPGIGAADLYYTGFGLRVLELLGPRLWCEECRRAALVWVRREVRRPEAGLAELNAWCAAERALGPEGGAGRGPEDGETRESVRRTLRRHITPEGAAGRVPGGAPGPYGTFLALTVEQGLGESWLCRENCLELMRQRLRRDQGFCESPAADSGGTNPTTAAIAVLREFGALTVFPRAEIRGFLAGMQRADGGFAAHAAAAGADLLSTFTALLGMHLLGLPPAGAPGRAARFVRACLRPNGLFAASPLDESGDTEYTYYGIGALSLLAEWAARAREGDAERNPAGARRPARGNGESSP